VEVADASATLSQDAQINQFYDDLGSWLYLVKDAMRDLKNDHPSGALPLLQTAFEGMKRKRLEIYRR